MCGSGRASVNLVGTPANNEEGGFMTRATTTPPSLAPRGSDQRFRDRIYDDPRHDPYQATGKYHEPAVCRSCGVVFHHGHWAWVTAPAVVREAHDLTPAWPEAALGQDQRQSGRSESYTVVFDADGRTYQYTPRNEEEFRSFEPGSRWKLEVNGFGGVTGVSPQ